MKYSNHENYDYELVIPFGLYSAYCLDHPGAPRISRGDQVRWIIAQYDKPGMLPLFDWAEICARAIRGEIERDIETLSEQEQLEIAFALSLFVQFLEETHDDEDTLEHLSDLRALAEEFVAEVQFKGRGS